MDRFLVGFDKALRVIAGVAAAQRPSPAATFPEERLDDSERRLSAGLMRVNHVGEVCAQALYEAQGRFSTDPAISEQFSIAAREEEDHLAWTALRLKELGSHPSLLNPLWYAGAYTLGALAAKVGDRYSLGFVVETERQVEAHLSSHLEKLPIQDVRSRAVVEQMRLDEIAHGAAANSLGAEKLPAPLQNAMTAMSRVMTTVAYYL